MAKGNDFVMVQLTEAGRKLANGWSLRISNGRRTFLFEQDTPLKVERSYEWNHVLANHHTPGGEALCEIVPGSTAVTKIESTADSAGTQPSTEQEPA